MTDMLIPFLPETAPFTAEQRAYLNGFLAGIFSRTPAAAIQADSPQPQSLLPLSVLFGSQTGNAERLAKRIVREAGQWGFAPTLRDLASYPTAQLASEERLLIVTSTYGDGEPPDNAKGFWQFLESAAAPKLLQTHYSICALGDSNYPQFCAFGRAVDQRLQTLGARPLHARVDCDVEFEEPFAKWLQGALSALQAAVAVPGQMPDAATSSRGARESQKSGASVSSASAGGAASLAFAGPSVAPLHNRQNPFPARLQTNRSLNGSTSEKDTRHFEMVLDGSGLSYDPGDALGVLPSNCPQLVEEILNVMKCSGEETVPGRDAKDVPFREALLCHYEITKIPQAFLKSMAERSGEPLLQKLTAPGVNGELTRFMWGREVIDLLLAYPTVKFSPPEFTSLLKKLQPRLYSISSSPKRHPGEVHLTVAIVRYESLSRKRKGVCSTFLAERVQLGDGVPVFIHSNKNFRLPASAETPVIMIGPGTGIAPFRAFLQERVALGAKGRNWLFFGDRSATTDFLYHDEVETMLRQGTLTKLDTAFSRDQAEKIYVQNRMRDGAKEIFAWLEEGAHLYVCGAINMARDVDTALHEIIQVAGDRTKEEAAGYVAQLQSEKRYQRDVY